MLRRARYFIACLLLLAFPLKGAFAASMVVCGTTQDRIAVAHELVSHVHYTGQDRDRDAEVGSGHHFAADEAQSPAQEAGEVRLDASGHAECGSCMSCCIGAFVIAAAAPTTPCFRGTDLGFPALTVQFSGHVPAALERPPHTFLV